MTTEEVGKELAQARIARGLTLHDVERDTRISRDYLHALEAGELEVIPAPVYARAFLRTYAQYLGLNAAALIQHLPGAKPDPEPQLTPLPQVGRQAAAPAISAGWMVGVVVVVLLVALGLLVLWDRGGEGETMLSGPAADGGIGQGAEQPVAPPDQQGPVVAVEPGIVPDLEDLPLASTVSALTQAQLRYLVIELKTADVPAGTVFQQTPPPGTALDKDTVITLLVSR